MENVSGIDRSVLRVLPLELRSKIYQEVLSSQNGIICLYRVSNDGPLYCIEEWGAGGVQELRLSFLRTCREIYEECKGKLWTWNTLNIEPLLFDGLRPSDTELLAGLPEILRTSVRSVVFDFDMMIYNIAHDNFRNSSLPSGLHLESILRALQKWAEVGKLEEITLLLKSDLDKEDRLFEHDQFLELLRLRHITIATSPNGIGTRTVYSDYLAVLERAGGKNGYLQHLKRKMILHTGPREFDENGIPSRSVPAALGSPDEMLCDLNQAWGGSLEMNGILCFENGQHIYDMFVKAKTSESEGSFYYCDEVRMHQVACYFSEMASYFLQICDIPVKRTTDFLVAHPDFYYEITNMCRKWVTSGLGKYDIDQKQQ